MPYQAVIKIDYEEEGEKKQEKQRQLKAIESPLGNHLQWGAVEAHSSPVL